MRQKDVNLRVCASCEWVFLRTDSPACPKCGFAHYGARSVYGNKAYRYAKTQEPWIKRKLDQYHSELLAEVSIIHKKGEENDT
jgi:hypothetical protein